MTAAQHFAQVPSANIQRSSFDRSHGHKTTFDAGWLIPVYVDEVYPGDTFNVRMTAFARLATPIFPIMDNMFMDTHFFYVPTRLLWDNWEKFNGAQKNPGDSTDFLLPQQVAPGGGYASGSLQDYMGIPPLKAGLTHSAIPLRAYNLIYNEWYRDQNLQNSLVVDTGDGPDTVTNYVLRRRGKRHDYFTSCLPWPQKGPAVIMPVGGLAPVTADSWLRQSSQNGSTSGFMYTLHTAATTNNAVGTAGNSTADNLVTTTRIGTADLAAAAGATVNQLRQSVQIQEMLERDARGGTRFTEILRSHFQVVSPDQRLQRPEYLGGGSTPVNVSPIPQTSSAAAQPTPQGNLAAMGTALARDHGFTQSFTEHGVIIGIVSVRADLTYQQGLKRMWSRRTRNDHYWPSFAHLGEQAVLRKEIWATGVPANDDVVFGYQERFAELRYSPSLISGLFRSDVPTPLDAWHLSQDFASAPVLDATFIEENPPVDRVIAVPSQPHFLFDGYFHERTARPMPTYSVPGWTSHF